MKILDLSIPAVGRKRCTPTAGIYGFTKTLDVGGILLCCFAKEIVVAHIL
jgi:hypothetical protein